MTTLIATPFDDNFCWKNYNKLPSVENAYSKVMNLNNFEGFFSEVQQLALECDVADYVAIRLAHRHWLVSEDQVMLEQPMVRYQKPALVTKATQKELVPVDVVPVSWMYNGEKYEKCEFSSDQQTIKAFEMVKERSDFFQKFLDIARKYHYESLLVPTIVANQDNEEEEGMMPIETNEDGESIVTVQKESDGFKTTPTTWSLKMQDVMRRCLQKCRDKNNCLHDESWI